MQFFWLLTMYNLPQRLLVDNPLDRYAIGSRTTGLMTEEDDRHSTTTGCEQNSNKLDRSQTSRSEARRTDFPHIGRAVNGQPQTPSITLRHLLRLGCQLIHS